MNIPGLFSPKASRHCRAEERNAQADRRRARTRPHPRRKCRARHKGAAKRDLEKLRALRHSDPRIARPEDWPEDAAPRRSRSRGNATLREPRPRLVVRCVNREPS